MVLGWKYLHSMQRFLVGFGGFCQNGKSCQIPTKPLHGMGFWRVLVIFVILAKTRCVSDLALSLFVRHAASFGHFDKNGAKTRCVSDKMSRFLRQVSRYLSSGGEFWARRLSARGPGKIGIGCRGLADLSDKQRVLGQNLRFYLRLVAYLTRIGQPAPTGPVLPGSLVEFGGFGFWADLALG